MIKDILNLKGAQKINKNQQESIKGGIGLPSTDDCGCVVVGRFGFQEIVAVSCDSTCPDGSVPTPGLGF
ncbi:hypothetical protein [Aquimarina sp. 2201CG14-23]|uniref:hypothetical protein n=1 Tax=Aquimarina mycalae TaxID=3040073 RepID=UPI002477EAD2|nr:hypothetical protein [Aquimarina sp. 2201CG14-23]MDH7446187.1 hypothetical protein [Aquimarina sp. 2201CG14-23]